MTTISGIGLSGMSMPQRPQAQALTDDQKSLIEETLQSFDPENLTEADALSIVEAFQEAGIQPGKELEELMSEYDFDARAIGDLAGADMPPPPPPPSAESSSLNITDEMLQNLNELINEYYSDSISDEEKESTLDAIKEIFAQTSPEGGLISITA